MGTGHLPITIIIYTFPFRPHLPAPHGREVHPIPSPGCQAYTNDDDNARYHVLVNAFCGFQNISLV